MKIKMITPADDFKQAFDHYITQRKAKQKNKKTIAKELQEDVYKIFVTFSRHNKTTEWAFLYGFVFKIESLVHTSLVWYYYDEGMMDNINPTLFNLLCYEYGVEKDKEELKANLKSSLQGVQGFITHTGFPLHFYEIDGYIAQIFDLEELWPFYLD